jgi:hypothetical protein
MRDEMLREANTKKLNEDRMKKEEEIKRSKML